ncbi:MAG: hypothetical protein JXR51_12680 [Bacteroidales bacterium]|nr:hypothetical protein [Bacteroidales bacterium]MBN2758025.1 hypothetical protein [Bacteroidales bacterium]
MKNILLSKIFWNEFHEPVKSKSSFIKKNVMLSIERLQIYEFDNLAYKYNENKGLLTAVLGNFSNWDELKLKYGNNLKNDVDLLELIYLNNSLDKMNDFISELDGIFLLYIYDENIKKVYLFQSIFGFSLPIYYYIDSHGIVISTNLKKLLLNVNIEREFDQNALSEFLGNNLISNEKTLIKNIKKLVTHSFFEINLEKKEIAIKPSSNKVPKINEKKAKINLISSIRKNIADVAGYLKTSVYDSTLTRGWDSNLIFNELKNTNYQKINAYTIDGGNEYSEVKEVKEIIEDNENISLYTHKINKSILDFLPDIVWKYEGFVFEMGIFLRYDLAKYLLNGKTNHIFVGSGADPILDSNMGPGGNHALQQYGYKTYKSTLYHLKKTLKMGIVGDIWFKFIIEETDFMRYKRKTFNNKTKLMYNLEIEYNLKMHEILFNEFSIAGIYPFLNKNTVSSANVLRKFNHGKNFYKNELKKLFGEKKSSFIKKTGKVLDTNRIYYENIDCLKSIINSAFSEKILDKSNLKLIRKKPDNYKTLLIQVAYLFLFSHIFLDNNYDDQFENNHLNLSLSDILKKQKLY